MDIGIVVATATEMAALDNAIRNTAWTENAGGFAVRHYRIGDHKIHAVQSGTGEIRAAAATQALIIGFRCQLIANFGVCGALAIGIPAAQPIIVMSVVHYDRDVSAVDNCEPEKYEPFNSIHIPATPAFVNRAVNAVTMYPATCASGDKFIGDAEKKREMYLTYGTEICDMESAGILITAHQSGIPTLVIKAVSDDCDGGAKEYWATVESAAANCAEALVKVLEGVSI